jgi:hypothetical protein
VKENTLMPRFFQVVGFLLIAVFAAIGLYQAAAADPPDFPATDLPLPDVVLPDSPAPDLASPAGQKIREALDDELPRHVTSGDGVLDDVIGIIKRRGSILDGSSLDTNVVIEHRRTNGNSKQAYVAEQLLKSSRLLEGIGSSDTNRADLVNKMRAEAVRLLSE